jgi:parallel beta-helix repeat protein
MMKSRKCAKRFAAMALALFSWAAVPSARALPPICVTDDTSLASALLATAFFPQTVQIAKGTYDLNGSVWSGGAAATPIQAGTRLLGGFTPDCSGRNIDAGNTVLGNSANAGGDGGEMLGDLTLEGLTLTTDLEFGNDRDFGGTDLPVGTALVFRRDAFYRSLLVDWGQSDDVDGTIRFVDSLFAGNSHALVCSVAVQVDSGSPDVDFVNNTIVDNTGATNSFGSGACFFDLGDGSAILRLFNNILYGNATADLTSETANVILVDNVIGKPNYPTPLFIPVGTLTGNPKLDANYRPIEAPPSPVIDSGTTDVFGGLPATDLPGRDRVVGVGPDRGAFESAVNNAFVQPVTSVGSSGIGSLRAAIDGAIAHGSGLITFDLGSGCPQTITLNSALPPITVPLIINGYTQDGSSQNTLDIGDDATLCVILKNGNSVGIGLQVPSTAADGTQVLIGGLAFSGFSDAAIDLQAGTGHSITGNRFGGSVGGTSLQQNGIGIRLGSAAHDSTIGGIDRADRNIIGGATGSGVVVQGGTVSHLVIGAYNNQIINNYIGVGWNENAGTYTNLGNGTRGVHLFGHDNTISGNLIGNNVQAGILVSNGAAQNNVIDGNFIGADAVGMALGNGNAGIHLTGDSGDAPTANTIRDNTIANNGDQGVYVDFGTRNKIRKNSIYSNGALGIDLAGAGVNPNDNDGALLVTIDYANRGLNFPVLTSAAGGYESGYVGGTLTTTGGDYTVDLYLNSSCDSSGNGEGSTWLRGATVTVPPTSPGFQTTAGFNIRIMQPSVNLAFLSGRKITATATDSAGNTSEFSACATYFNDTIFANGFEQPPG